MVNKIKKPNNNRQNAAQRCCVNLSECGALYAVAIGDAFSGAAKQGQLCVPDSTVVPSVKRKMFARGTFSTGTTGVGGAWFSPYVPTSDGAQITGTSATSVCTTASTRQTATNTVVTSYRSTFTNADISADGLQWRLVAAGLRIRYRGTELNRGGTITVYRQPDNTTADTTTIAFIRIEPTSVLTPVKNQWVSVNWKPVKATDYTFSVSTTGSHCMALIVEGADLNPQTYEFEVIGHFETIGRSSDAIPTMSHSDPVAFGNVLEVAQGNLPIKPTTVLSDLAAALVTTSSTVLGVDPQSAKALGQLAPQVLVAGETMATWVKGWGQEKVGYM